MIPHCQYHPGVPMLRVEGPPPLKMYGKPKPATHEYFRCPVSHCPFCMTVEIPQPARKIKHAGFRHRAVKLVLIGQFR
jgi:hypothetical protein